MGIIGSGGTPIPTQYTCTIGVSYTPEDTETYAMPFVVDVVECPDVVAESMWNCNLCGGDERYEQPVLDTDNFYLQFPNRQSAFYDLYSFIVTPEGEIVPMTQAEWGNVIGLFVTNDGISDYFNVKLTPADIPVNCFYIKTVLFDSALNFTTLGECISDKMDDGLSYHEAFHDCLLEQMPSATIHTTDLYRKTSADCEDTILFTADYDDKHDCHGRYYGVNGSGERYIHRVRIPGTVEPTDLSLETTKVFESTRKNRILESSLVRSQKIPPYVVSQVIIALGGRRVLINSTEYFDPTPLQKNNDEGRMWILNFTVQWKCGETDFACD